MLNSKIFIQPEKIKCTVSSNIVISLNQSCYIFANTKNVMSYSTIFNLKFTPFVLTFIEFNISKVLF